MLKQLITVCKNANKSVETNQKAEGGFLIAHFKRYLERYDPLNYKKEDNEKERIRSLDGTYE